ETFADLVGATQLIPGPNSSELAMHLGSQRAGWPGFWVAGICFILPAVALVWGIAWGYGAVGARLEVQAALTGMQPVILAVIVQALWRLHRSLVRTWWAGLLGALAIVGQLIGVSEMLLVGIAVAVGFGVGLVRTSRMSRSASDELVPSDPEEKPRGVLVPIASAPLLPVLAVGTVAATAAVTPWMILVAFLRIGSVLFGSGYVLLSFLRAEFGTRLGALTDAQLLDAIAIGQVTPGPVFSAATFVGYLLAGHAGALAATVGIFAPAFVAAAATAPYVVRLRQHTVWSAALDAVNGVSFALMAGVVAVMVHGIRAAPVSVAIFGGASAVLILTRIGTGWVLLTGAAIGMWPLLR
ncbi:MAG: hypothetical protein RLZZ621_1866, partial [Gemmatimonadota bacterium]